MPAFHISRFPVTNEQYAAFVSDTAKQPPGHWDAEGVPPGLERHPVTRVSWQDAQAFCEWLTRRAGERVRLPSEAEWEFAARGVEGRTYPWGEEEPDERLVNFGDPGGGTTAVEAHPAGATPDGVHDLAGNVWEWCQDEWHRSYEGAPADGSAWEEDGSGARVLRGGSFGAHPLVMRAAYRDDLRPDFRYDYLGFRVVWRGAGGQA